MKYNKQTTENIMRVAITLFAEQGYYQTTTKQIAEKAGVNELTIFRHFGSKSNLFQVTTEHYVIDSHVDYIFNDLEGKSFEEDMLVISKRAYALLLENTKLYKVQMKLADSDKDLVKLKLSRKLIIVLSRYFNGLINDKIINCDTELMAVTLVNSLVGIFTLEILSDSTVTSIPYKTLVEEHTKQFVSLYKIQ